jgi:hypothetical protein
MGADLAELLEQEHMSCPRVRPWCAVRLGCQGVRPLLPLLIGLWGLNAGEAKTYKDGYFLTEKAIAMDRHSY